MLPSFTKGDCYLIDLDGTLCDCEHRRHHVDGSEKKDWNAFYAAAVDDEPVTAIHRLCWDLACQTRLVYVTGRPEQCRSATEAWLTKHGMLNYPLYMRGDGDFRADDIVKLELLERLKADGHNPVMAFDDRTRVVKMWRAAGIPCAQVAEGDF